MDLTAEIVLALAPDVAVAGAARSLAAPACWQRLGQNEAALWGECRGSALYQVRVDRKDLVAKCSCPSRKFPCKHSLGLLLLAAEMPDEIPHTETPPAVVEWLAKRAVTAEQRRNKEQQDVTEPAPAAAPDVSSTPSKTAERRLARVAAGIEGLNLWLDDLIRNGLAGLELQPAGFWEKQAARMVDAQAPGLAARLRRLGGIPGGSSDWSEQLLSGLGRLALLTEAFQRIDYLDPGLQADVRTAIGWTLKEDEVLARGERLTDDWLVLGRQIQEEDRLRAQRSWLYGARSGRGAMLLQFAVGSAPFAEAPVPGTRLEATLVYWPSAYPQRALIHERKDTARRLRGGLPGHSTLAAFMAEVAVALSCQPWLERFPCVLSGVMPVPHASGPWQIQDLTGAALPLAYGDHWQLLALSGGAPIDLAGEWNGHVIVPLGATVEDTYYPLWDAR